MRTAAEKKSKVLKFIPAAIAVLMLISVLPAAGADWKTYAKSVNKDMEYLYLPESINISSPDMVKVWTKIILLSRDRIDEHMEKRKALRMSTDGYENYAYSKYLKVFDCKNRMHSRFSFIDYDRRHSVLDSYDYNSPLWKPVVPESAPEQLYRIVCPVKGAVE